MKLLLEKNRRIVHKGTFINDRMFLDPEGEVYDLQKSDVDPTELKNSDGNKGDNKEKSPFDPPTKPDKPNNPPEPPEPPKGKIPPDPNKTYIDVNSGRSYKWNGEAFVEV